MKSAAVQLSFEAEGLDPRALATVPIVERAALYDELDLHPLQRQLAEEAVAAVLRGQYRREWS